MLSDNLLSTHVITSASRCNPHLLQKTSSSGSYLIVGRTPGILQGSSKRNNETNKYKYIQPKTYIEPLYGNPTHTLVPHGIETLYCCFQFMLSYENQPFPTQVPYIVAMCIEIAYPWQSVFDAL